MGIKRICIEGLSTEETDLIEMKIRDMVTQMGKAVQKAATTLLVWREDDEEK